MCNVVTFKIGDRTVSIADIKKNHIENTAEKAVACSQIDKIILFGSAISESCSEKSDIDIAVFGSLPESCMLKSKSYKNFVRELFKYDYTQDYDILYFNTLKDNNAAILDNINAGEVLYEKA